MIRRGEIHWVDLGKAAALKSKIALRTLLLTLRTPITPEVEIQEKRRTHYND